MPKAPSDKPTFDQLAARLVSAAEAHDEKAFALEDYRAVLKTLARYARGFGFSSADAEEIAAAALADALSHSSDPTKDEVRKAGAYLFRTTRNRALDARRRARLRDDELLVEDLEEGVPARYYSQNDEDIARLINNDATVALLEDALRAAAAAEDHIVGHVVEAWLDLADELRKTPTSREVAREIGMSHTTVNHALRRLRDYFPVQ
jgi:DNA-directed RNA polymerase specialized sigma24 family protein